MQGGHINLHGLRKESLGVGIVEVDRIGWLGIDAYSSKLDFEA